MPNPETVLLNDGRRMPAIGLGLWRVSDEEAERIVCQGVEEGYRLLDTAAFYGNETGVGQGIRSCGLPREQLFVTTKVWNDRHGYDETLAAFEESMEKLGLEYLDLYLIHWPVANSEKYLDSWRAFIKLRESGRVKSIGVSNFLVRHVEKLVEVSQVAPVVNQIEYHPYFQQKEVEDANRRHCILTEAWAPLGRGKPFTDPVVTRLAEKYGKTPSQIILRWQVEEKRVPIPKSAHAERMRENMAVFDFSLTSEEVGELSGVKTVYRIGDDPETFSLPSGGNA